MAVVTFVSLLGWADRTRGEPSGGPDHFATVQRRLIRDGFDRSLVRALYSRPEVAFDQKGVTAYFLLREAMLNYDQFLSKSSIDHAIDYLSKYGKALQEAQKLYGVEAEVITAIILVESRLGTSIGKRLVLNTLSSLAALDSKVNRGMLWHTYVIHKAPRSRHQFDTWAFRKSAWAYCELKAYLQYVKAQNVDPFSAHGSRAGALGIAQFMPSSAIQFAQDGNKDGQINLYQHADAIESIANYLKQHGWRPGLSRHEAFRILLCYNCSKYYAETILKVAERLSRRSLK
ncbi:MAG: lytic murein transglycosylase [Desulfobacterales bacterium]|nr:lytic murein transglycosylase [Desulfobacterales bacterium]